MAYAPVFRIVIPLALGILMAEHGANAWLAAALAVVAAVGYIWIRATATTPRQRLQRRGYYIVPIALASMALGITTAWVHAPAEIDWKTVNGHGMLARVISLRHTDFSTRMTVTPLGIERNGKWENAPACKLDVSTRGCDYTLHEGDLVSMPCQWKEITNLGNPYEMDMAAYQRHQGMRYTQHIAVGHIHKVGSAPSLLSRLARVRHRLQTAVANSTLSPRSQHFIIALLLGNNRLIDADTREMFSAAGIAHILALSGLHIGILSLIVWWLLFPLDYIGQRKLRLVITLALLAGYAVFTGLAPSVARATLMTGAAMTGVITYRRNTAINSLGTAALIILVFSPSSLFAIGFQLSFITVASLIVFLRTPLRTNNRVLNYALSLAMTSLVALASTSVLSAHYFHNVTFVSVLSNIFILPVLPVMMITGAFLLALCAAGWEIPALNTVFDWMYDYIVLVADKANGLPLSHLQHVEVTTTTVVIYYVALGFAAAWLLTKRYRYCLLSLFMVLAITMHSTVLDLMRPASGTIVLKSFNSTPVLHYCGTSGYVWIPEEEEPDLSQFRRFYNGLLSHYNIDELTLLTDEEIAAWALP